MTESCSFCRTEDVPLEDYTSRGDREPWRLCQFCEVSTVVRGAHLDNMGKGTPTEHELLQRPIVRDLAAMMHALSDKARSDG